MKASTARWWIAALVLAVAALVALLGPLVFELVDETEDIGYRGEAARNPLLAAERLLTRMGMRASSSPALGPLPDVDSCLFLRDSGRFMSRDTAARLLEWCERGGHLIALFPGDLPFQESIEDDLEEGRFVMPLADALGIACVLDDTSGEIESLDLDQGPLALRLPGRFVFEDLESAADIVVGDPLRARLLSVPRGLGRVTLVADDRWATNAELGEHDHARALWQLATLEGQRERALVIFGERAAGLFSLVWEHGWPFVVSGLLALALALWRAAARFGPLLPELSTDRRDFSEHVVAAGGFLWRHRASATLLAAPREELRRRIQLTRPDWSELPASELAAHLAPLAAFDEARVRRALELHETDQAAEFVAVVRDLQELRKAL
ncbi:MAG: hypothetical protein IT454_23010 [Planctomycetes bacterium]|nr:hypothetical protein [Planctomycetota bacterium]